MNPEEPQGGMIGARTAFALYAVLTVVAAYSLHGKARLLAFIIVGGLAAKSLVEFLRRRAG